MLFAFRFDALLFWWLLLVVVLDWFTGLLVWVLWLVCSCSTVALVICVACRNFGLFVVLCDLAVLGCGVCLVDVFV